MKKTEEVVQLPSTTMFFPIVELTIDEIEKLYVIGHFKPVTLKAFVINVEDVEKVIAQTGKRLSHTQVIDNFVNEHQNDPEILKDVVLFSEGKIDLLDMSVKYALDYKDLKKTFKKCLPDTDVDGLWKKHKKFAQKKTNKKVYGVEDSWNNPEVKAKREASMMAKYGELTNMHSKESKEKLKKTMLKKYGVEYAFQKESLKIQDNWFQQLFDKLSDENWKKVLLTIAKENNWDLNPSIFDKDHLDLHPKNVAFSGNDFVAVTNVLTQFKNIIGRPIKFPSDPWFEINISGGFGHPWLQYYSRLGLVNVPNIDELSKDSASEKLVAALLYENGIEYRHNVRKILGEHELDFYFPEQKIALEINPNTTHNSNLFNNDTNRTMFQSHKPNAYHYNKYKEAQKKGIMLIQWFSPDLGNEMIKNVSFPRLLSLLKGYETRVYARDIEIKKFAKTQAKPARDFIARNHVQGNAPASEYWGFYLNNELIAAASFVIGKNDVKNPKKTELKRLAFEPGTQIIGGLSKLVSHFAKEHPEETELISYSDNNLGDGHGYKAAGARFVKETKQSLKFISYSNPEDSYSWMIETEQGSHNKNGVLYKETVAKGLSELKTQKERQKFIENELPHRLDNKKGYDRIYNAGSKKWVFDLK